MKGLTQERLKEVISYNPDTGIFKWIKPTTTSVKADTIITSKNRQGYLRVMLDTKLYMCHRLAFLYMEGRIPEYVDHINNIVDDNRWVNLREATYNENNFNRLINYNNTVGIKGISFRRAYGEHGYIARVQIYGKRYSKWFSVSSYGTKEATLEAATVYIRKLRESLHGEFTNHG